MTFVSTDRIQEHDHRDQNAFMIYKGGNSPGIDGWLLADASTYSSNFWADTDLHNTMMIGGTEQRFGAGTAVAGIRRPPRDLRSPLSGCSTTIRSPVSRMSSRCCFLRGFGTAADFGIRPIVRAAGPERRRVGCVRRERRRGRCQRRGIQPRQCAGVPRRRGSHQLCDAARAAGADCFVVKGESYEVLVRAICRTGRPSNGWNHKKGNQT